MSKPGSLTGLADVRVIELAGNTCGPYVGKLFADAGADVIKVEPAKGDPMRRYASDPAFLKKRGGDGAFFQYLNANKRSVTGAPDDEEIRKLIGGADLLIEDFSAGSDELEKLDIDQLRAEFPHLVVLSLSAYGRTGPYAERASNEFIVQAEAGATAPRGFPERKPYFAGGRVAEFLGASYSAVAASAMVRGAQRTGHGDHIDFSLIEAFNIGSTIYFDLMWSILGRLEVPGPMRTIEIPSIEKAKDGWVGVNTNSRQQFDDFLVMIEKGEWLGDEELASNWSRINRYEEWTEAVDAWMAERTIAEVIELASVFRIPAATVGNGENLLEQEHFKARGVFEKNPAGDFMQPRPPYQMNGQRVRALSPAPGLGEHSGKVEPRTPAAPSAPTAEPELPMQGMRVLDASAWWAGPSATQMFGTLGADVIHLESIHRIDGGRAVVATGTAGESWWETSHLYNGANFNKRSLTLDLNKDAGMALLEALIKQCDVLVENYSPRVFENFGLTWEKIKSLNPTIVFVRMPAYGLEGPWRDRVGFAQTIEMMSGLAWLTGHTDDQPRVQRGTCDPLAGTQAAFAIIAALKERDVTGEGVFLECAMAEGALNAAAEQLVEYTAYGHLMNREGNRAPTAAPQGLYYCQLDEGQAPEDENLLALSVENDSQWQAFREALGSPSWATDPRFDTHAGRREHHDEIDEHIETWSRAQGYDEAVGALLSKGVPAGKVELPRNAYVHPQFVARRFLEDVEHPVIGTHPVPGMPFRLASRGEEGWIYRHAPTLGQHNHEILSELLGQSEDDIAALERDEVIGTKPSGLD